MFFEGHAVLPSRGNGSISQQLADLLPSGSIHLNKEVMRITTESEIILNDNQKIKAKIILLATDPWSAAKLLELPLPPSGHGVITAYYAAEKSPLNEPILFLMVMQLSN